MHLIIIDMERAYDRVPKLKDNLWKALEMKRIRIAYIQAIKDMDEQATTSVRRKWEHKHIQAIEDMLFIYVIYEHLGFRLSTGKTKYMECRFSKRRSTPSLEVIVGGPYDTESHTDAGLYAALDYQVRTLISNHII